jgi:hypothetical protein
MAATATTITPAVSAGNLFFFFTVVFPRDCVCEFIGELARDVGKDGGDGGDKELPTRH